MNSHSRRWLVAVLLLGSTAGVLGFSRLSVGDPPAATKADAPAPSDWQADPVCQMVFFAVLEGLYKDGVPTAAINALVPPEVAEGKSDIKASFVFRCPLCHPVYEALRVYQKRPAFIDDTQKRDTFGKGLAADELTALSSSDVKTRLKALAPIVQRYVARRLDGMKLTPEQKQDWLQKLTERSNQGKAQLVNFVRTQDPDYKEWSPYWGCAACNGVTDACRKMQP